MTKLTISFNNLMSLPPWVSHWAFNALCEPNAALKNLADFRVEKMLRCGFVEFHRVYINDNYGVEYIITFDTEENKLKFIMEFL